MKQIAIIIPAYKTRFLKKTLDSIACQTNRNFTLYVGDDASPEDIWEVVEPYKNQMEIVYHRFETNLGSRDLTAHWERCIRLSHEPVIWLFSDDDLMPFDAVERIERMLERAGTERVMFRFPLTVVDGQGHELRRNPEAVCVDTTAYSLLLDKLCGRIDSAACEYVFSRDVWEQAGGFVSFPLAWCSDDATWVKFGNYAGKIGMLSGRPVCWRNAEGANICNSSLYDREKLEATRQFICWIREECKDHLDDEQLHQALAVYVQTILRCSVQWHYSTVELYGLCRALWGISPQASFRTAVRHFRKRSVSRHSIQRMATDNLRRLLTLRILWQRFCLSFHTYPIR